MKKSSFSVCVLAMLCLASRIAAQTTTWIGSTGNWSASGNWNNGTPVAGDTVIFNSNASASVDAAFTMTDLEFIGSAAQDITDGGGSLTLTGEITYGSSGTLSIEAPIIGVSSVWLNGGTGTLTLNPTSSGANTFSGSTQVFAGGTLADGKAYSFSDNSVMYVGGSPHGAVNVNYNEAIAALGDVGGGIGYVNLASGTTLFINGGYSSDFSGIIQGSGNVEKDGVGTQQLAGPNTYTGSTTIGTGGAIEIGDGTNVGSLTTSVIQGAGSLSFREPSASNTTISAPITGTLDVDSNGPGTVKLSGNNTYTGPTTINSGTLQAGSTTAFGASTQTLVVNGGILDLNGFNISLPAIQTAASGGISLTSGATLTLTNSITGSTTIAGVVSGTGSINTSEYQLNVTSNGMMYSGGTTISAGTFIANNSNPGDYATGIGPITILAAGTLLLGQANTNGYIYSGSAVTDNGQLEFFRTDITPLVISNTITGTGGIQQNGSGMVELSGNNSYSGVTEIFNGTLIAGSANAFGGASGKSQLQFPYQGTVDLNGFNVTVGSLSGTATTGGINLGANTLTLNDTSADTTLAAPITGTGGSMVFGQAGIILEGNNTYTGSTTITNGFVLVANSTGYGLGTGALSISAGAALDIGAESTAGFINNGPITDNGAINFNRSDQPTYSNVISGTGSITTNGGGIILTGANTYAGSSNFAAGTSILDNATGSATGTGLIAIASGATLQIGNNDANGSVGTGITINDQGTLTFDRTDNPTSDVTITGTGGLSMVGTGNVTLFQNNNYSGPTLIENGQFTAGSTTAFGNGYSNLTILSNGRLNMTGFDLYFGSLTGDASAVITTGAGRLTIGGNFLDTLYAGTITGAGSLNVVPLGTLEFSGANLYTGTTTINANAALVLDDGGSIVSNATGAGTLEFNHDDNITYSGTLGGTLTVEQEGPGTTTLSGNNVGFSGTFNLNNGTLQAGGTDAFGSGSESINIYESATLDLGNNIVVASQLGSAIGTYINIGSGTLQLQGGAGNTIGSTISGTGVIALNGTGTTTLEADNSSFTGTFDVYGGTLATPAANALGNGGASLFIDGNAILDLSGVDQSLAQISSSGGTMTIDLDSANLTLTGNANNLIWGSVIGNGSLILNGTGTTSFWGTSTYSGATMLNAGTLSDASANSLSPNSDLFVASGAVLAPTASEVVGSLQSTGSGGLIVIPASSSLTSMGLDYATDFQGVISGSGEFIVGGGVQGLSGNNTYTGGTLVTGGGELFVGSNSALGAGTVTFDSGTEFSPSVNVTLSNNIVLENGESLDNDDGGINNMTLTGVISQTGGSGGFTWCTPGTLTLTGANTFTGTVDMREGTLVLGNNTAAGVGGTIILDTSTALNVMSGVTVSNPISFTGGPAVLTGSGTINSYILAGSSTVIAPAASPGNGPGTLSFSDGLTLASGSAIHFDIYDANGAAGTGYSLISASGGLNITASTNTITFNIVSTNATGIAAPAINFNSGTPYSWTFASSPTLITGFNSNEFNIVESGFQNSIGPGFFSVSDSGNSLQLNFTPVPEPSTWCLIGGAVLLIVPLTLRRRSVARAA